MKTYLIQRGRFQNQNHKSGIDSIIRFDYMGAAEFEFGTLTESLKIIRDNINDYIYQEISLNKKIITVFYNKKHENDIVEFLTKLSENKFTLKEWTDFESYIYDKEDYLNTNFWWDIENHLMFWKENSEFIDKFKQLMENKIQVTIKPNAVEIKGKNRRFEIIKPLKNPNSDSNELMENTNIIFIKSLLKNTNQNTDICKIVGKTKETILGFTDDALYELTLGLIKYHNNKYKNEK